MITAYNKRTRQLTRVEAAHVLRPASEWVVNPLIEDYEALMQAPNDIWDFNEETSVLRVLTELELDTLPDRVSTAKSIKTRQLSNACSNAILAGFLSSATGTQYWYDFDLVDQQNIMASIFFGQPTPDRPYGASTLYGVKTPVEMEKVFVSHSLEQMMQVARDASNHRASQVQKLSYLLEQVANLNTVAAVNAVSWN